MKKLMMLSLVATALYFSASAQKLSNKNVPLAVMASFQKQYPGITAKWEKEKDQFEANFKTGKSSVSVLYMADGTISETEFSIQPASLPLPVLAYIKANYKGAAVKEAAKIIKANGDINYEAEVKGKDLIFNKDGNFLK